MYTTSITIDGVIDALATFLQPFCNGLDIVRAQVNRTPMPGIACVVLTELLRIPLETSGITYDTVNDAMVITGPAQIDIQIDFYGPDSGDQCNSVAAAFRTIYATSKFPDNIKPLFCSDGKQSPLITGEHQWDSRWMLTASLQYNPVVSVPQQFADMISNNVPIPADLL